MSKRAWRLTASFGWPETNPLPRVVSGLAFACGALVASQASAAITIQVLSSMPQLVTGGDALVKISGATAAPTVTIGADRRFRRIQGRRQRQLHRPRHRAQGRRQRAGREGRRRHRRRVTLTNHAINGTLFAGPQQAPYLCENETFELAPAKDASCAAPTIVKYFYRDKTNTWKPFDPAGARPGDIATVKIDGKDVP